MSLGCPCTCLDLSSWAPGVGHSKICFPSALRRKLSPTVGPVATGWATEPVCLRMLMQEPVRGKDQEATFLEISEEAYGEGKAGTSPSESSAHSTLCQEFFHPTGAHEIPQTGRYCLCVIGGDPEAEK